MAEGVRFTLGELAQITQGTGDGASSPILFHGVSTDTRQLSPGALFIAIPGERYDGHDYLATARAAGAVGALVSRPVADPLPQVVVPHTRRALGQLATAWRQRFTGPVVAITGSNGKTTVKEMVRAILSQQGPTLATLGNLNNDIGLPLTLLRLDPAQHRYAVVELGANHPGEIAELVAMARPTVALVNNAGPAHLEGFGSVAGVAQAKGEIYGGLLPGGTAIINGDDDYAEVWRRLAVGHPTLDFSLERPAAVQGTLVETLANASRLAITTPSGAVTLRVPLPGRHNARNALAATAAALAVGIDLAVIATAIENVGSVAGRLRPGLGLAGSAVIDDTYNANPASFQAAMEVLAGLPGTRLLVLGDMAELGPHALALHEGVGRQARALGIDGVWGCGPLSKAAVTAFGHGGHHYDSLETLMAELLGQLAVGVTVLVKGSRSAGMERVVRALTPSGETLARSS